MAELNKIRYKDFTFPNNPETTGFKCDRSYIKHKYPELIGNELEDFGVDAIIITGSGYFFGWDAYVKFNMLYNEFQKGGVGDFIHPIYTQVQRGLMVSLESTVDAEVNAIKYSFEVIADSKPNVVENVVSYAIVESVPEQTDAGTGDTQTASKQSFKVGDIVNFHGGMHYENSYPDAKGYKALAGKAKITLGPDCKGNGGAHPWHLIHTETSFTPVVGGGNNEYGWVDEGTFSHLPTVTEKYVVKDSDGKVISTDKLTVQQLLGRNPSISSSTPEVN